ncbi:hypothetical protein GCE86_06940 [Micromonospora terminaliae]|uniref:Uncharacterized protein n=1 Tax=Micromonospora terminaliae TaxID=1914461 RepID=A0AAJ3DKS9_9ACTN|nr:hypothetical protein [Micromonospora terminaliae]NES30016.1 hypothetical protein [Micromonospora terminaliae]QGL46809.1 hypothetical protein GCE86_06940 [Micromonospora terminaliae]
MTTVLVTLAVVAAVVAVMVGFVSWRDRRRAAEEDPAAVRAARAERHRRAAEREHAQHDGWNNGGHGFTG